VVPPTDRADSGGRAEASAGRIYNLAWRDPVCEAAGRRPPSKWPTASRASPYQMAVSVPIGPRDLGTPFASYGRCTDRMNGPPEGVKGCSGLHSHSLSSP
jgi:hypothetical protein